jgi:SAM-dependent methyltransferase
VLDLGANTGALSETAARCGADVVAVDSDADAVAVIWHRAMAENLSILPLIVDLLDPTPARGWDNGETASFVDRCAHRFDMVIAAAFLHWIVVVGRVPMDAAIDLFARCTTRWMTIEWIPLSDPQIASFGDWGEDAASRWSRAAFDGAVAKHFRVLESAVIAEGGREMILLERTNAVAC